MTKPSYSPIYVIDHPTFHDVVMIPNVDLVEYVFTDKNGERMSSGFMTADTLKSLAKQVVVFKQATGDQ